MILPKKVNGCIIPRHAPNQQKQKQKKITHLVLIEDVKHFLETGVINDVSLALLVPEECSAQSTEIRQRHSSVTVISNGPMRAEVNRQDGLRARIDEL